MGRISAPVIASILTDRPARARVGLTVRDERTRERAADALATTIIEQVSDEPVVDSREIPLGL